jgi:hypothetical protein
MASPDFQDLKAPSVSRPLGRSSVESAARCNIVLHCGFYEEIISLRFCSRTWAAQCWEVHIRKPARGAEGRDCDVAAPNHTKSDSRNHKPSGRAGCAN